MRELEKLGWDDAWEAAFEPHRADGLEPGRIAVPHRGGAYDVLTADGETRARLPGRLSTQYLFPCRDAGLSSV